MISIGSNVQSLVVQRQLDRATALVSSTSERLASGQRINRASDDAAGLSVSMSLSTDARVFNQAIRNLNDGISAISIADGASEQLSTILTRISELAEQSANGTINNRQRLSLDREAKALRLEFNRIIDTTQFNGVNLLGDKLAAIRLSDGSRSTRFALNVGSLNLGTGKAGTLDMSGGGGFQGGRAEFVDLDGDGVKDRVVSDSSGVITISKGTGEGNFTVQKSFSVGQDGLLYSGDFDGDGDSDIGFFGSSNSTLYVLSSNGNGTLGAPVAVYASGNAPLAVRDIDGDGITDFVTQSGSTIRTYLGTQQGSFRLSQATLGQAQSVTAFDMDGDSKLDLIQSDGTKWYVSLGNGDGTFRASRSFANTNNVHAVGDVNGDGRDDIVSNDGVSYYVSLSTGSSFTNLSPSYSFGTPGPSGMALGDLNNDGNLDIVALDGDNTPYILVGNGNGTFQAARDAGIGGGPVGSYGELELTDANNDGVLDIYLSDQYLGTENDGYLFMQRTKSTSRLNEINLQTRSGSLAALDYMNSSRSALSLSRSTLGAQERRVSSALENLRTSRENYIAADSRIKDADVASEAATAIQSKVRQQFASAILAQANSSPGLALQLLRSA